MSPGDTTPGVRLADGEHAYDYYAVPDGAYWLEADGTWRVKTPNGMGGVLGRSNHHVVEHDDGTITVSPSILVDRPHRSTPMTWHGYLEHGAWREA